MSQCRDILAVLRDGQEHEMRDLHRVVGFCRMNSRVAELRKRGWGIECRREGQLYFYRLVSTPGAGSAHKGGAPDPSPGTGCVLLPAPGAAASELCEAIDVPAPDNTQLVLL